MKISKILNLTQHSASAEQIEVGVYDPHSDIKERIKEAITFDSLPNQCELENSAFELVRICIKLNADIVMIGGAPFFMPVLERALRLNGIQPVYAYSKRVSTEKDGIKTSVFKHLGFVESLKTYVGLGWEVFKENLLKIYKEEGSPKVAYNIIAKATRSGHGSWALAISSEGEIIEGECFYENHEISEFKECEIPSDIKTRGFTKTFLFYITF